MKNVILSSTKRSLQHREPEALIKLVGSLLLVLLFSFLYGFDFLNPILPKPAVSIIQDKNGNYQLLADKKPFVIKAVCYNPIPIGKDYSYDFWQQDFEVFKMDAELMRQMGVNAIRIYHPGVDLKRTKEVINFFYEKYGIRTIMGNWLGFWDGPFPDYANPEFRNRVKRECLAVVKKFKDEPAILMWVLGNENNFSFGKERLRVWTSPQLDSIADPAAKREAMAEIYYKFIDDLAAEIKKIDKLHPIALGNGGLDHIEVAKKFSNNLDLLTCSVYSGKSFSSSFRRIKDNFGKPFFFSEFGCDSFDALKNQPDEEMQAEFIKWQWKEIGRNLASGNQEGNCLGGAVFEWTDEWWKHDEYDQSSYSTHDEGAGWSNGAYYFDIAAPKNLNMNEEWWGVVKQADTSGKLLRIPKKAYYTLQELWREE